ncbi:hypothetical protein BDA96_10G297300 [Sorghum bicolor]|uniref:Uncharacterized protein n=1 Tax=Sorghum bicolor TaxID=4558 RepID=A0A921U2F5_SORBI|nr:hypothetical protein BDA96_10G297300 [Sorghum bicolor]
MRITAAPLAPIVSCLACSRLVGHRIIPVLEPVCVCLLPCNCKKLLPAGLLAVAELRRHCSCCCLPESERITTFLPDHQCFNF